MPFLETLDYIVAITGSYSIHSAICGSFYLLALGLMTLLTWKTKPVDSGRCWLSVIADGNVNRHNTKLNPAQ
jgi:hypothetical protein